jgi:hypothetical protein
LIQRRKDKEKTERLRLHPGLFHFLSLVLRGGGGEDTVVEIMASLQSMA